jgi:hypothetical protein
MCGNVRKATLHVIVPVAALLSSVALSAAQEVTGTPGAPDATTTVDGHYLPNPPPAFGGEIGLSAKDSNPTGRRRSFRPRARPISF